MDIKEIQEQAYKKGFADGQATLGAEFMCKKSVSCEDVNTKYLEFPDGLRLIFREGKYVGWYVCEGHEESKGISELEMNTKCGSCIHKDACLAWIRHGKAVYEDFVFSVDRCPYRNFCQRSKR